MYMSGVFNFLRNPMDSEWTLLNVFLGLNDHFCFLMYIKSKQILTCTRVSFKCHIILII